MVTNIGTVKAAGVVIITDAVGKDGTWNLYVEPERIMGPQFQPVLLYSEKAGSDDLKETWGAMELGFTFQNIRWALTGSGGNMEKMKRAIQQWNNDGTILYLWRLDVNGYNQATWGDDDGAGVSQIRCLTPGLNEHDDNASTHFFDLTVTRASA